MPNRPSKGHSNLHVHNWLVYRQIDRFLINNAGLISGKLYDLGCGESHYKDFILNSASEYVGVDWQNSVHETNPDIVADLNCRLDIADFEADVAFSFSVLEHLREPKIFLSEVFRILKPAGNLILQVPWQWHLHEEPHDYYRYSPHVLNLLLSEAGFQDIKIDSMGGYFTALVLKFNYFSGRSILEFPAIIKYGMALLLLPLWTIGQMMAPLLDKLDAEWSKETPGYFVTARKPASGDVIEK